MEVDLLEIVFKVKLDNVYYYQNYHYQTIITYIVFIIFTNLESRDCTKNKIVILNIL